MSTLKLSISDMLQAKYFSRNGQEHRGGRIITRMVVAAKKLCYQQRAKPKLADSENLTGGMGAMVTALLPTCHKRVLC